MDHNYAANAPSVCSKMRPTDSAIISQSPNPTNMNGYTSNGNLSANANANGNGNDNGNGKDKKNENGAGNDVSPEVDEHLRKIFIGGLSTHTTVDTVRRFFRQFGEMSDAVVMRDPISNHSRGFGFVTYVDTESVENVQRARPHIIDNKPVETKRALPRLEFSKSNGQTNAKSSKIFLGGLRDCHSEESIREYFSQFGNVSSIKLLLDKETGRKRGFGFLEFEDMASADRALVQGKHTINYSMVEVKKSSQKYDPGKRIRFPVGGAARAGYIPPQPAIIDNFTMSPGYNPYLAQTTLPPSAFINGWASYVTPTAPVYYGAPRQQQQQHHQQHGYPLGYDQELGNYSAAHSRPHYIPQEWIGANNGPWPPKTFRGNNTSNIVRPRNEYKSVKPVTAAATATANAIATGGPPNAKQTLVVKPVELGAGGDAGSSAVLVDNKWPTDNFKVFQPSSKQPNRINPFHNDGPKPTYGI